MERIETTITLRYVEQLSPENLHRAKALLLQLPPGWHWGIPLAARHIQGGIPKQAIAHALLYLLDPTTFPAVRRTRILAGYIEFILNETTRLQQYHS